MSTGSKNLKVKAIIVSPEAIYPFQSFKGTLSSSYFLGLPACNKTHEFPAKRVSKANKCRTMDNTVHDMRVVKTLLPNPEASLNPSKKSSGS